MGRGDAGSVVRKCDANSPALIAWVVNSGNSHANQTAPVDCLNAVYHHVPKHLPDFRRHAPYFRFVPVLLSQNRVLFSEPSIYKRQHRLQNFGGTEGCVPVPAS